MDIDVGDVVVCVHLKPRGTPYDASLAKLRAGKLYRVVCRDRFDGIYLDGVKSTYPTGVWNQSRFRKIGPADPEFVEQMERIVREHQPVSPLVTV